MPVPTGRVHGRSWSLDFIMAIGLAVAIGMLVYLVRHGPSRQQIGSTNAAPSSFPVEKP